MRAMPDMVELSERELEILKLVATGASNKEIAQQLYISANTVKVHLRNIFAKIEVTSRTEAAMYAVNNGLVERDLTAAPFPSITDQAAGVLIDETVDPTIGEAGIPATADSSPRTPPSRALRILLVALAVGLVGFLLVLINQNGGAGLVIPPATGAAGTGTEAVEQAASWQEIESMPTARSGFALAGLENRLYAIAGRTDAGLTGSVERFDPSAGEWTSLAQKPTPVEHVSAAVIGGRVYVPGGQLESGSASDVLEVYDPRQDAWETGPNVPQAVSGYALVAFEGHLYLFGGWDGQTYLDSVYRYDPGGQEWRTLPPLPAARAYSGAAAAGGKIYLMGGENQSGALLANEVFLPDRLEDDLPPWEAGSPLPDARPRAGVASIADILYVSGSEGQGDGEAGALMYYIPQTDTWGRLPLRGAPVTQAAFTAVGPYLFLVGGQEGEAAAARAYAYQTMYTISIPIIVK
jgi:DNA-binding CsgD family transcriptional regulator